MTAQAPHPGSATDGRSRMLLGIDLGTTTIKALLISPTGEPLGIGRQSHGTSGSGGIAEQDPETWWQGTVTAVRRALAEAWDDGATELAGLCVVGQGPTTVAVGDAGGSMGPAITWLDARAAETADHLSRSIGVPTWQLGSLAHERWMATHDPDRHARATCFLSAWDWLTWRLSGRLVRAVPPVSLHPTDETIRAGGGDPARFGSAVEWGTLVGGVAPGPAAELGIPAGTPVIAGGNDALASFHGAGLVDAGDAVDTGGTSGGLGVYWDRELDVPGTYRAPAALPGLWLYGGAMNALGKSVEWVTELLAPHGGADAAELLAAAFEVPAGAAGLVFLPYLAGERAPIEDRRARGMLAGLSLDHGRGHVVRAVLEAGGYALRHVAEPIRDAGIEPRRLVVSGAAERIHGTARMRADILGLPVDVPVVADTAAAGAAILAAVGAGVHPDARSAIRSMVRIERRIEPDPATRTTYDELSAVYRALYPATATLQHRLADIGERIAG